MRTRPVEAAGVELVRRSGFVVLIAGAVIFVLALSRFDILPNWLRIAALIPVMTAFPMIRIDRYQNWDATRGLERGWAIGALLAPPMLLIGSLVWLIAAPHAHG